MMISKANFYATISYNYTLDNFYRNTLLLSSSQQKPSKTFISKLNKIYQNSTKPRCVSACLCLVYNMFTKLYCLKCISCLVLPNLLKVSSRLYLSEYVPDFYLLAITVICSFQDEALKLYCFHPYPPDYFLSQIAVPNWYAGTTSHLILTVWKQNQTVSFLLLEFFCPYNFEPYLKCMLTWQFNIYSYYPCLSSLCWWV